MPASLTPERQAIAQLQALARRIDQPGADGDDGPALNLKQLVERIAGLIDQQQKDHAEIRALHADLANQQFAADQHAIVSITDLKGRITHVNDRFCEISGYSREELLGARHSLINSGHHPPAYLDELWKVVKSGRVWHGEIRNRKKNGDCYWVDATFVPLMNADGSLAQFIGIRTDITERKRIEHDLQLAKEVAEAANRAKTEFLSSMSHELRTPMNAILGFAQLMQAEQPSADQAENLNEIVHAGHHLLELINKVLDLARVESGHIDLSPEPLLLADVIDECLPLIQPLARKQDISVLCSVTCLQAATQPRACACPVFADRLRLRQVLLNLLSNGVKYNRAGGRVEIRCEGTGEQACISVTDSGPGIAPELQPRLFKPFERLETSPYQGGIEGTGIGLALSKQLIEAMGGHIGLHSASGSGSTFWITLPKAMDDRPASPVKSLPPAPAGAAPMQNHQTHTLLYIEDNPANLRLVQKIMGMRPQLALLDAPNAEIGLAVAEARLPHLILMDINLPGMNGFEALRRLRANPATRSIPVLAISANAMLRDIDNAREAGFDDYLTKPLDIPRFLALLDASLAARSS